MRLIEQVKPWLGRKSVRGALVIVIIVALILVFTGNDEAIENNFTDTKTVVQLTSPVEYAGGQSLSLIGTARAFNEASVTSEKAGRVVSVNVELGQTVVAGQILGRLENASEQASVLQAEGAYDAAVAAAAQSDVGVDEAQTNLRNAQNAAVSGFQSAYNTNNGIVRNSIDSFFANPEGRIPGLRLDGKGLATDLNDERVAYQQILLDWQTKANTISASSDLDQELEYAKTQTQRTIRFVDTFLTILAQQDTQGKAEEAENQARINEFTGLRSTLIGVQSSIDGAQAGLYSARDLVKKADLAAAGGVTSAADAQVKQALGSLRAAQANLNKTYFRTPISGTVNSLSIRTGDFVNSFSVVAQIANNDALEIVTYISDNERTLLSEGDLVLIEGEYEGRVANIAPAVSTATGKTEVRIAAETSSITNGDTVRITKEISNGDLDLDQILIPLSSVKFASEDGSVFVVVDGKLEAHPVSLGVVRGASVEVLEGLTATDEFVVDARGLLAGTEVEITD